MPYPSVAQMPTCTFERGYGHPVFVGDVYVLTTSLGEQPIIRTPRSVGISVPRVLKGSPCRAPLEWGRACERTLKYKGIHPFGQQLSLAYLRTITRAPTGIEAQISRESIHSVLSCTPSHRLRICLAAIQLTEGFDEGCGVVSQWVYGLQVGAAGPWWGCTVYCG